MDELHDREEDHSDAMAPIQLHFNKSLAGEQTALAPVTTEKFNAATQLQTHRTEHLQQLIESVAYTVTGVWAA